MIKDGIAGIEKDITSFLMIGQSNMAGRGDFGEVEPIDNSNCFMLRMGRWQKMSEPINPDRAIFNPKAHSGVSLGASFADSYAKHFSAKIGLIPCADGGTAISLWQPGEILFDHAVFMARLAMRTSTLGGILFHQGENDCNETDIELYKERALRTITEIRKELNASELPFIIGELSEDLSPENKCSEFSARMNLIFKEMEKEIPNCRVVSSKGLSLKDDGLHFNSAALREFGNRYFEAYLDLVKSN